MGGGSGAELGGVQGLPLTAGTQHEEDGLHADAVGLAGPTAAEAVSVWVFGQQGSDGFPEIIRDAPIVGDGAFVHGRTSAQRQSSRHKDTRTLHIATLMPLFG
jgi:hypothetical protein